MKVCVSVLATTLALATASTQASIIQKNFSLEYTGGTAPVGAPAWLSVKLDDAGSNGSVTMTVTATNLTASEFVSKLMLNLDPALNPTLLTFSSPTKVGTFADPTFSTGANLFSAGGGSNFDLLVEFDNSPPANRFGSGESMSTVIGGIPTLSANSFNFNSSGGSGALNIAAHVQGIGPSANLSGWITIAVPEPTGVAGLAACSLIRRRR